MKNVLTRLVRFFSSFALAVTVLILLLVLTYLGTLEQRFRSIYDVQRDYFESVIVVSRTLGATAEDPQGGFPIPLPGAYLLLTVLAVNLIVGGVVRLRKRATTIGILITHLGIAVLLFGGLIEYHFSTKGAMKLYPGQERAEYSSYHDWDVFVTEQFPDGSGKTYVIPEERISGLDAGERARFESKALPFAVELHGYQRNSRAVLAPGRGGVDGFMLRELEPENPSEQNVPGVYVTLIEPDGAKQDGVLWGLATGVFRVAIDDREFGIKISKREWELPFALRLERFEKEDHARTSMARAYSSYVKKIEGGAVQDIHITMNEPLRHRGYTFYQSGFDDRLGPERTATVLSVVENPTDRVPEYAFYVIGLGLLVHFLLKLIRHIEAENRRQQHAAS